MKKLLLLAAAVPLLAAALEFDSVFQSNMVLQRGVSVPVSGKALPGEKITLSFAGYILKGTAGKDGIWRVVLPALEASKENRSMILQGKNQKVILKNILTGEVWFCSGQSNMHWKLHQSLNGKEVAAQSNYPLIRTLVVDANTSVKPVETFKSSWRSITPANAGKLSGVGFYFARELHRKLNIPVGLVCVTRGGTMIEPWTPAGAWESYPAVKKQVEKIYRKIPGKKPRLQDSTQNQPHLIYNGAVHPLRHITFRGVIWYQGCSNVWNDTEEIYFLKQKALFEGWKKAFNAPELKFYFVQLAPLKRPAQYVRKHVDIWLAQQRFADSDKNVKMAVINDVGDLNDIHPVNKEPVGKRLAAFALKYDYGENIRADFPRVKKAVCKGKTVELLFSHANGWKSTDGKAVQNFEIAGKNGRFYAAKAEISGKVLKISSPQVDKPAALRYMFNACKTGNLLNDAGLPPGTFEIKLPYSSR